MDGALPNAEAGTPGSRTGLAAVVLALLALVAALYLARAFFIPLLIGILASYALRPAVDWLGKCRVPRAVAAALVLAAVVGGFSWIAFSLRDDAAAKELQGAATDAAGAAAPARASPAIVVLLAFFLLAAGEHFRRKLRARERRGAVHCAAVLRLVVGRLGSAARRAADRHRQGGLRPDRIAPSGGSAARPLGLRRSRCSHRMLPGVQMPLSARMTMALLWLEAIR
jgi:hypothetical protein